MRDRPKWETEIDICKNANGFFFIIDTPEVKIKSKNSFKSVEKALGTARVITTALGILPVTVAVQIPYEGE